MKQFHDEAMERMKTIRKNVIITSPFFSILASRPKFIPIKNMQVEFDAPIGSAVGTMSTDGEDIYYDPDAILKAPLKDLEWVFKHELLHRIQRHCGRFGDYTANTQKNYNIAADLSVNYLLYEAEGWFVRGVVIPGFGQYGHFPPNRTTEFYLSMLEKEDEESQNDNGNDKSDEGESSENGSNSNETEGDSEREDDNETNNGGDNEDSEGDGDADDERNEDNSSNEESVESRIIEQIQKTGGDLISNNKEYREETREVLSDMGNTKMMIESIMRIGSLPGAYQQLIKDILAPPKIHWKRQLQMFMTARERIRLNWKKCSRRFREDIIMPRRGNRTLGKTRIVTDTSGSMSHILPKMVPEIAGIAHQFPNSDIAIIMCDAEIQGKIQIKKHVPIDWNKINWQGFGGTDMSPGFIEAEKDRPDLLICVTDGYIPHFPDKPLCNVIWIIPEFMKQRGIFEKLPYGSVVAIPNEEWQEMKQ